MRKNFSAKSRRPNPQIVGGPHIVDGETASSKPRDAGEIHHLRLRLVAGVHDKDVNALLGFPRIILWGRYGLRLVIIRSIDEWLRRSIERSVLVESE